MSEIAQASPETSMPSQGQGEQQNSGQNSAPLIKDGHTPSKTSGNPMAPGKDGKIQTPLPPKTEAPKLYDVKVNNKVVKMTEQELVLHASKSHAADSRFNEAAKMREQHQRFQEQVKKNAIQALMDPELGLTKDQIREQFESWYNDEFIETEKLSPDQKRAKDLEAQIKKYEEKEKAELEKKAADEEEVSLGKEREYYQGQIIDAMEKSGLPKTEDNAKRMAFYMRQNLKNGWDAPIEMIVQQVKNDQKSWGSNLTEHSTVEQMIEVLGEGVIQKINQHYLNQLRESRKTGTQSFGKVSDPTPKDSNKKASYADVDDKLRYMREHGF